MLSTIIEMLRTKDVSNLHPYRQKDKTQQVYTIYTSKNKQESVYSVESSELSDD